MFFSSNFRIPMNLLAKISIMSSYVVISIFITCCSLFHAAYTVDVDDKGRKVINGSLSWEEWQSEAGWDSYSTDEFQPIEPIVIMMKSAVVEKNIKFLMFAGSWCGDSKTELPKFFKIITMSEIDNERYILYGVDRQKREHCGIAEKYQIEKVPTLIVLKDGAEIGRIVEFPKISWDADLADIILK